jgi:hypothetical protein
MKVKPLIETNPYLKNPETRKRLVARSVATSCGVEGIKTTDKPTTKINIPRKRTRRILKELSRH